MSEFFFLVNYVLIKFGFLLTAYHCELNPIEMIWAQLKSYVRKRNTTSKIKDVERLVLEAIDSITPEAWAKCVEHVKKQEIYFWEKDLEMQKFENDELEDVQFGALDEVIAGDVAAAQYKNPQSKLNHSFQTAVCLHLQTKTKCTCA